MATYTVLKTSEYNLDPENIDRVTLKIEFENPVGNPISLVQKILTNNGSANDKSNPDKGYFNFPIGPISDEDKPAFFQAYADLIESMYVPITEE